jgi:hypothetical protein
MYKVSSWALAGVAFLMFLAVAPSARAGAIDTLTMTSSGPNTIFTISGTYTPGTPTTAFSSPGVAYSLTFSLATTPFSVGVLDAQDGLFGLKTTAMVNGVTFTNSEVLFSLGGSNGPGGLAICLGQACNPVNLSPTFWDIAGSQLFTNSLSNPTFLSGSAKIDFATSGYQINGPGGPTPEPASILLLGTGLFGLGAALRFRHV